MGYTTEMLELYWSIGADLEDALTDNITKFLTELGQGFAYIGRQVSICAGGDDLPKYASLRPVYSLNILHDSYYRDKHPLRIFELHDPVRNIRPEENPVYLAFFELKKDNRVSKEIDFWRQYFLTGEAPAGAPEYIEKAAEIIRIVNLDEEERAMMNRTERAIEFNKSMIMQEHLDWKNEGRAEGRVEGIEIGEKRSKIDTARQMKKKGYAPEEIREITGISLRDLKGL